MQMRPLKIKTRLINFQQWAQKQADFLLKTNHRDTEVVAAFLPCENLVSKFNQSADGKLLEIDLEQIVAEQVLEFDVFVFLAANEKYVLYNKKGRTMFTDQKQRLIDRGVKCVHVLKDEIAGFYRYQAQNYVNSKISEFQSTESNL